MAEKIHNNERWSDCIRKNFELPPGEACLPVWDGAGMITGTRIIVDKEGKRESMLFRAVEEANEAKVKNLPHYRELLGLDMEFIASSRIKLSEDWRKFNPKAKVNPYAKAPPILIAQANPKVIKCYNWIEERGVFEEAADEIW